MWPGPGRAAAGVHVGQGRGSPARQGGGAERAAVGADVAGCAPLVASVDEDKKREGAARGGLRPRFRPGGGCDQP